MSTSAAQQPSPQLFFQTINAHMRTEALKAGIELEVFTAIGEGNTTAADIAKRCGASEKGIRVLCDYLTIMEMLTKKDGHYGLTLDSSVFLDKRSPAYLGGATEFLCSPMLTEGSKHMTEAIRKGGTAMEGDGTVGPEHPVWVRFARGMAPMMAMPAQLIANLVDPSADRKLKILDIAAGHGLYGITFAARNNQAEVTAVDWKAVLEVAKENAQKMGVADRYKTIETLLRKVHAALADGGRAVTLEFVPNDDRVTPPDAAGFSMMMLVGTPSGDAYTFAELERMFANAGFSRSTVHPLPPSIQQVVISEK
jgi:hypothetical protein